MPYTLFNREVSEDCSYLLLGVYYEDRYYCGSYYKNEDGEFITCILTGDKFYSLRDFVESIHGHEVFDEWYECAFYDEDLCDWVSLIHL